jgi:hypothetical protein
VLTFNINTYNDRWDAIAHAIRTAKPDIATIIESSIESTEELSQRLTDLFPYVYRTSSGGLTIFSRFPPISSQTKIFDHGSILVTSLLINRKVVEVIAAHPRVPVKPNFFKDRNASLDISKSLDLSLALAFSDCIGLCHCLPSNEEVGVSDGSDAKLSDHRRTDRSRSTLVSDIFEKTK